MNQQIMEFFLTEVYQWRILIGVLVLLSIFLLVGWTGRQRPGKFRLFLSQAGIVIAIVVLLAMVFSGYLHWIFAVIGGLLPIVIRLLPLLWRAAAAKPQAPEPASARAGESSRGRASSSAKSSDDNGYTKVETRYLRMSLSEKTGEMRGKIRRGAHANAHLSELNLEKLQALHAEYTRRDGESAALLAAYIEQVHGVKQESGETKSEETQEKSRQHKQRKANGKGMSREEAYEILGPKTGADATAVTEAHRRLMQKMHPDRGGTNYLAAKINQAKDLLAG